MSNSTYFCQVCPTCGRRLQIRVEYLGKRVVCQHCQGQFVATDPATQRYDTVHGASSDIMRRAEELLQTVTERKPESRTPYPR